MKVTLNRESWHYRLFKKELPYTNAPASLCPYFWTIVGLCLVTPFLSAGRGLEKASKWVGSLIPKPKKVVKPKQSHDEWLDEWNERIKKDRIKQDRLDKIGKVFGKGILYLVSVCGGIGVIFGIYTLATTTKLIELVVAIILVVSMVGFVLGLVWAIEKFGHYLADWIVRFFSWINPLKWSITKMIGWMIVAGYKKMCPLVEWSGEEIKKEETYQSYLK
jgi:hypothetical protein